MTATERLLRKRGSDATIRTYTSSGTDSYGDPDWTVDTSTSTKAIVELPNRTDPVVVTISGEERQVDAVIWVPSEDAVDPTSEDRPPQVEVGGVQYRIGMLDPHVLGTVRRLLCVRMR